MWLYGKRADLPRTSLEPLLRAAEELGCPHLRLKSLQIAGTNGKGSVCHKLARAFHLSKIRAGLFTSPHLDHYSERICIDLVPIEPHAILHHLNAIIKRLPPRSLQALNFFDLTLLIALLHFEKNRVDVAILEAGIGGRLDATSICQPHITAITSIGLDHQQMLGATKREIAAEKGGIIRSNIPLVLGPQATGFGLEELAREKRADLYAVAGIDQHFDEINKRVAQEMLALLSKTHRLDGVSVHEALAHLPPGRFEVMKRPQGVAIWPGALIIDVAHNEQAFEKLVELAKSRQLKRPLHIIFGLSRSKDLDPCLRALQKLSPERLYPHELENGQGHSCNQIAAAAASCKIPLGEREGGKSPLASSMQHPGTLLICGSFYLAAEVRQTLRLFEI